MHPVALPPSPYLSLCLLLFPLEIPLLSLAPPYPHSLLLRFISSRLLCPPSLLLFSFACSVFPKCLALPPSLSAARVH